MTDTAPTGADRDEQIYTVSVAAELAGMHAQTLRQYDRLGLVSPQRAKGRGRRYSGGEVARLREIQSLTQEGGVNLAGVALVLQLREQVKQLASELLELKRSVSESAVPASRVFTADRDGHVRLRAPKHPSVGALQSRSDSNGSDSGTEEKTRGEKPEFDVQLAAPMKALGMGASTGKTMVFASPLAGWQRLAWLQLSRRFGSRSSDAENTSGTSSS